MTTKMKYLRLIFKNVLRNKRRTLLTVSSIAVSLFLNSGEYEGGFLRFPEYGSALYAAPTGGAVVFGCSMLHEATRVTRGKRYMFLPFLYDDAAALVRQENSKYLEPDSAT